MSGLTGRLRLLLALLFGLTGASLCAQTSNPITAKDSTESRGIKQMSLDSVLVTARHQTSALRTVPDGYVWRMDIMQDLPKILGNADPMHYAQMLPGVQTNGEYTSGLHVQGFDNQHNDYTILGVPIYNVNHLLGFFSAFNASHYTAMHLSKYPQTAAAYNRLGATLDMQPTTLLQDTINGELSVGLISSQGTLRLPVGQKTQLTLSARASYLNLLYSHWLMAEEAHIKYSFYDLNVSLLHQFDPQNRLLVDAYMGGDRGDVRDRGYLCDIGDHWGNSCAAVHWLHDGMSRWQMKHTLYVTHFYNRLSLDLASIHFGLPSGITDYGYKGQVAWKRWTAGADILLHDVQNQQPELSGTYHTPMLLPPHAFGSEFSLYADYEHPLSSRMKMNMGLRGTAFFNGRSHYGSLAPNFQISYAAGEWYASLGYSLRNQYLAQTGFSSIGLPTEFWTMAGNDDVQPQRGHGFTATLKWNLFDRRWQLALDGYYKWLDGQLEYDGNFYDFLVSEYSLSNHLLHGHGRNYGISLMLMKTTGRLTGWISYSWGRALRTFNETGFQGTYPANHERIHELNLLATWRLNRRWTLGATYVLASGTPFTAPQYFYLINGKAVAQYASHNANRLPAYSRLDLSVNLRLGSLSPTAVEQGLNFSFYNALWRNNSLYFRMKVYQAGVAYKHTTFVLEMLPSVSYYLKF